MQRELVDWWRELEPRFLGYAQSLTRSDALAQDAVQDLAVKAIIKESFDSKDGFRRWAFVRLTGIIIDAFRATAKERQHLAQYLRESPSVLDPSYDEELHSRRVLRDSLKALSTFPERQRLILVDMLRGMSDSESARRLGIAPATVRSLRRHGRRRLAEILSAKLPP